MAPIEILETIGDEYSPAILRATSQPKSAKQLSDELDIPIATCYRRIDDLVDLGLLEQHDRPLSQDGRRVYRYRRSVDEICARFSHDSIGIRVTERAEVQAKLDTAWQAAAEG